VFTFCLCAFLPSNSITNLYYSVICTVLFFYTVCYSHYNLHCMSAQTSTVDTHSRRVDTYVKNTPRDIFSVQMKCLLDWHSVAENGDLWLVSHARLFILPIAKNHLGTRLTFGSVRIKHGLIAINSHAWKQIVCKRTSTIYGHWRLPFRHE